MTFGWKEISYFFFAKMKREKSLKMKKKDTEDICPSGTRLEFPWPFQSPTVACLLESRSSICSCPSVCVCVRVCVRGCVRGWVFDIFETL